VTGARYYAKQRERQRAAAIRTARAVAGATYMSRLESRPHVVAAGDFVCVNCGIGVTNDTPDDCPGTSPAEPK